MNEKKYFWLDLRGILLEYMIKCKKYKLQLIEEKYKYSHSIFRCEATYLLDGYTSSQKLIPPSSGHWGCGEHSFTNSDYGWSYDVKFCYEEKTNLEALS